MSKILAVGLVIIATLFGAPAALFFKKGTTNFSIRSIKLFISSINKMLILGFILFIADFIVYIYALKQAPLSFVFPIASVTYIWIVLLSCIFLKEKLNKYKLIGIALIVGGVIILSLS